LGVLTAALEAADVAVRALEEERESSGRTFERWQRDLREEDDKVDDDEEEEEEEEEEDSEHDDDNDNDDDDGMNAYDQEVHEGMAAEAAARMRREALFAAAPLAAAHFTRAAVLAAIATAAHMHWPHPQPQNQSQNQKPKQKQLQTQEQQTSGEWEGWRDAALGALRAARRLGHDPVAAWWGDIHGRSSRHPLHGIHDMTVYLIQLQLNVSPRFLGSLARYDVASDMYWAPPSGANTPACFAPRPRPNPPPPPPPPKLLQPPRRPRHCPRHPGPLHPLKPLRLRQSVTRRSLLS
jgi:hypothetical protein